MLATGSYALVLQATSPGKVQVGRWGSLDLRPGYYVYVGSAFGPGGLAARIGRHVRLSKRPHWHIDYLRAVTRLQAVWYSDADGRLEHAWARTLEDWAGVEPVRGFGSSDCRCSAHLFFMASAPAVDAFAARAPGAAQPWPLQ